MSVGLFDDGTRGATISPCGRYRYDLWRRWDDGPLMAFIMLNPSVADADVDDRTVRRCIGFARRESLAGITIRNLYAFRTPKPAALKLAYRSGVDIVGPDNDDWLRRLAEDRFSFGLVVAAWGVSGPRAMGERCAFVRDLIGGRLHRMDDVRPMATPPPVAPHPLYLPATTPITPYPSARSA